MRFSYTTNVRNQGLIVKTPAEETEYTIDWNDGLLTGDTISTVTSAARDDTNADAATNLLDTTTNAGTLTTVRLLTGGTSGTSDATNGARFKITTTATTANGAELQYAIFVHIAGGTTYDPTD